MGYSSRSRADRARTPRASQPVDGTDAEILGVRAPAGGPEAETLGVRAPPSGADAVILGIGAWMGGPEAEILGIREILAITHLLPTG